MSVDKKRCSNSLYTLYDADYRTESCNSYSAWYPVHYKTAYRWPMLKFELTRTRTCPKIILTRMHLYTQDHPCTNDMHRSCTNAQKQSASTDMQWTPLFGFGTLTRTHIIQIHTRTHRRRHQYGVISCPFHRSKELQFVLILIVNTTSKQDRLAPGHVQKGASPLLWQLGGNIDYVKPSSSNIVLEQWIGLSPAGLIIMTGIHDGRGEGGVRQTALLVLKCHTLVVTSYSLHVYRAVLVT